MNMHRQNPKACVTLIPTVTASGKKLKLGWINNAKTFQAVRTMKLSPHVHSYVADKGWITRSIMLDWLKEIVIPYLHGRSGALVLDNYPAHEGCNIQELCDAHSIELIYLPPNCTKDAQPLDVSVMGPFKSHRQTVAMEHRWMNSSVLDSKEEAVNRANIAWERVSSSAILKGWHAVCPVLQED